MSNLTTTDLIIIAAFLLVILVLVSIIIVLDILNKKKKLEDTEELLELEHNFNEMQKSESSKLIDNIEESSELPIEVNSATSNKPARVEEIKYVEEDKELEKTKAKIELKRLKEELERQRINNTQTELAKSVEEEIFEKKEEVSPVVEQVKSEPIVNEVKLEEPVVVEEVKPVEETVIEENIPVEETVVEEEKPVEQQVVEDTKVSDIVNEIKVDVDKEQESKSNLSKAISVQEDLEEILKSYDKQIEAHENEQEEKAIISVTELQKVAENVYDDNEDYQMSYKDEGNEPISIKELEKLYNTTNLKEVVEEVKEEEKPIIIDQSQIKKLEDLPPISSDIKFRLSPFISPVFGIKKTRESIELEQTANLDKLNEEIKKTNEFLKALKDLQKDLD